MSNGIRSYLAGTVKEYLMLIFWRCLTGLFAGSQIVTQAYKHM